MLRQDSTLVEQAERTTETVVEMNNGCICCTLRGDFIEGMQKVLKDVRARGSHLDGVLIETTGLADPSPIASTFFLDPFMQENYRLDSILVVCDAKHLMSQLSEVRAKSCVNEASEQVAFSDRLLLTKTDLCTEMEIRGVVEHLRHLNPFAKVLPMNLKDLEQPIPVDQLCDLPIASKLFRFEFYFHFSGGIDKRTPLSYKLVDNPTNYRYTISPSC